MHGLSNRHYAKGGSSKASERPQVDLTYVAEAAKAAKAAGVCHFSLVTSKGASAWVPASSFVGLHPLLYLRTKGRAEEAAKAQARRCPRPRPSSHLILLLDEP